MQKKTTIKRGLIDIPVYETDTSLTSPDYFAITEFPNRLTAGKNIIKLRGNPNIFQPGTQLQVEVLDYNNDPIYSEFLTTFIDEDNSRVIVIYIYTDTSPGDATITLLSTLKNVPPEWQNKPNIKWSRNVAVNPTANNITDIIFETPPTVNITEQVGVQLNRSYTTQQFTQYSDGQISFIDRNSTPIAIIQGGEFNSDMKGGTLTVSSPQNSQPTPNININNNEYTSTIKKVLSSNSIELDSRYIVFSSQSLFSHVYNSFDLSNYTIDYEETPVYTPTQNSESFAFIEIEGLDPAAGDVNRIKVYISGEGTVGTYELINDIELEETDIFVPSTSSITPYVNIGEITSQSIIDSYWNGVTYTGKSTSTSPTLTYESSSLNNALSVVPTVNIPRKNDVYLLQVSESISGKFIKNAQYKVSFDAIANKHVTSNNQNPKIHVYMSGSSFNYDVTDYYNQELPKKVGKKIGELEIKSTSQRIDDKTFYFNADNTGTGILIFIIESGAWSFSDIRTTTDNDPGYTPNYTRFRTEIPTKHKSGNQLSFKIEYYNINGDRSQLITFKRNLDWSGGNRYIDGDFSMITGSLYVADSLETGIAISGLSGTGFIRSLGYSGFDFGDPGFLLWSGSALPGQNTKGGVPYSGVGLELYANNDNYFRYATQPSELDIRTERFFVGDIDSAFISGSDGNIEISSSGFHLNAAGDVTASSFVAIQGSDILFDSNNEYIDGNNVGRVIYFDRNEFEHTGNIQTTPVTSSIFETFLLPGETSIQSSFTIQFDRAVTGTTTTIQGRWFIQSASNIDGATSTDAYDTWSTAEDITGVILGGYTSIMSFSPVLGTDIRGTSRNFNLDDSNIAKYAGKYCRIYMITRRVSNGNSSDILRMKNFVYRSARLIGASTEPVAVPLPKS